MAKELATVEEVRETQKLLQNGISMHEKKDFDGAIEAFKKATMVSPLEEGHLGELEKKLTRGGFKLEQKSIAYMGCAAVHLSGMAQELTEEQRAEVPMSEKLEEMFDEWALNE
jgi:hypothetical protein